VTSPKPAPPKPAPPRSAAAKAARPGKSVSLKGEPGGILWLLQHELRLYWRRGKMRPRSGLILVGFMMTIWLAITFFIFLRVGHSIPAPPFNEGPIAGLALAGVSLAIAFVTSVMVSSAILGAIEAIYTRNDLDLLLSTPLSPWRILIVRSSAIAVGALPLYAGLLGPPMLWLAIFSSPLWLSSIIFLVTLAFAATGIALLIVTALFRLIGPRNTRVIAQIVSALVGAAVFLTFQYFNLNARRTGPMTPDDIESMVAHFHITPTDWWLFPARAMIGDIVATTLWVVLAALIFAGGVFLFSRSFVSDAAAASAMGRRKRETDVRVAAVRGGVISSVVRKEFRLLRRDPVLLSQIGLQMVYLLPLAFVLLRPGGGVSLTPAAFAPALTLLSSALCGSLIWITVSAEDAPDLIASAPVAIRHVERAKLFAAIAPVLLAMLVPLVALFVRDPWAGFWALGGVVFASTASSLIGMWRRNPGSRKDFVRRRQGGSVMTSLGQTFVALGGAGAVGLGAYGFPWLAIIPAIIAGAILGVLYKPSPTLAAVA
jgi:ABC-2 type transport system permease protein